VTEQAVDISIVVPVFNEEENLPVFYRKTKRVLQSLKRSYEFVFVNDGSSDHSLEVLHDLAAKDISVKFLDFTRNFGQQAALTAGLDYSSGKAIITMDCDLQDPPEIIAKMVDKWMGGAAIVYARRSKRNDKFFKKHSALFYYKLLSRFSDIKIEGNIGDFRLVDRKVLVALKGMREKSRYLRGMVAWLGYDFEIIEYERPERVHGKTGFSMLKMVRLGMIGILNFSLLPLRLGLVLGLFSMFVGFGFLTYVAIDTLFFDELYPLFKWLSIVMFIFIGFLFILVWIMAEYVGQIYNETKGRPIYVVNERVNLQDEYSHSEL